MTKEKNIIFGILCFILLITLLFVLDLKLSPDSKTFINYSKYITSPSLILSVGEPLYIMSYLIFKFLLAFGDFDLNYKIFNFLSYILIILYTQKILEHFKIYLENRSVYIFFYFLFFFNFEILQWTLFALTDLILVFLMLASIYYFIKKKLFISVLIILFSLLIKPQSIFIIFIISYLFLIKLGWSSIKFFILYFLFYIFIISLSYILNIYKADIHLFNICYKIFLQSMHEGNIVDDRYYIEYNNYTSIFKIYILRLISIFSIYFTEFSLKHKIYKIIYFTVLYLPILIFIYKKNKFEKLFINFAASSIFIIVTFITLTFIDYDLRYRMYFYPFLIMLSTYCFKQIYEIQKK